jgi:hypothetical protein
MMEDLIYNYESLSINKDWYDNSDFSLYYKEGSVFTKNAISNGQFIGYIDGIKSYTWEVPPNRFCIWINDYYVLDCRSTPRCITSMIRKNNVEGFANCTMAFSYKNDTVDVYIIATCDIPENTELVVLQEYLDDYL